MNGRSIERVRLVLVRVAIGLAVPSCLGVAADGAGEFTEEERGWWAVQPLREVPDRAARAWGTLAGGVCDRDTGAVCGSALAIKWPGVTANSGSVSGVVRGIGARHAEPVGGIAAEPHQSVRTKSLCDP